MKMRKTIAILTAICAVFAFTGIAMAQNRVEVKVTSEPIGYKAICDKAGGFSLEFDTDTSIVAGDQITIDLSYMSPSDFASICKAINFEISAGGDALNVVANRWNAVTLLPSTAPNNGPFYWVGTAPTALNNGVYFRVHAALNSQRITVDVMGDVGGSVTVGPNVNDKLVLTFLDQKSNAIDFVVNPGLYTPTIAGLYTVPATPSDNTLCVNVSNWSGATVKGNMDSRADKFTFIPSDPQIAHIAPAATFAFAVCDKTATGRINCGVRGVQANDTCTSFDFETKAGISGAFGRNRVIISSNSPLPVTNYQIRLEILVNGLTGSNGVFWTNETVLADGYDTNAAACAVDDAGILLLPAVGNQANYVYLNGAGLPTLPALPTAAAPGSCDVASTTRAVSLTTNEAALSLDLTSRYLMINIPAMRYDLDEINVDDVVSVRVTLIKAPCGTVFQGTIQIGTMCAAPVVPAIAVNTLVYPYFTAMANDNWWDGLVITNLTATTGNFTALIYEQDGDVGSFTGIIDPNSLYQGTLQNALAGASLVTAGGDGVLGNSLCYILVCTDFTADGFAFMGSLSTNSLMANESMGYLPRVDYIGAADQITFCNALGVVPGVNP